MEYFRFVYPYLRRYAFALSIILVFIILETVFYSSIAFSFKFIIDDALLGENHKLLVAIFTYLGVGGIILLFVALYRDYLQSRTIANILMDIRTDVFSHLQNLSMDYFSSSQSGDILLHFSSELGAIETTAFSTITLAIQPALSLMTSFILLAILSWKLALVVLIASPIILIGPKIISSAVAKESYQERKNEAKLLSHIQESITTQLVNHAFELHEYMSKQFARLNKKVTATIIRVNFLNDIATRAADTSAMYLQIIVLGIGAYLTYKKSLTVGSLVSFQTIFTSLIYTLAFMAQYLSSLMQGTAGVRRIEEFIAIKPKIVDQSNALQVAQFSNEIEFHDVAFGYDEKQQQLENASFKIKRGESVAFVGSSGAGKTTILNLIMRMYDPDSGKITLDGIDFRDIAHGSLHYLMGYVFQESLLLDATIRENIRLGKLNASDSEIEEAAKAAEIHDLILSFPDGYETRVGERGGRLSGGQKQRIAIARAIIRAPVILILDEATSALDPTTEEAVSKTLRKLGETRTNITVTHRLNTITHVDHIFVLQHGKICESGNHATLLELGGAYKKLWNKQHGFIVNQEKDEVTITSERLRFIPLFTNLPANFLEKIVVNFATVSFNENHVVFEENDIGDSFYIIVRGSVEIFKTSVDRLDTRIATLQDGDYFGEIALLNEIPRTAKAVTLTPCTFLVLKFHDFITLLDSAPELRKIIETQAEQRLLEHSNF